MSGIVNILNVAKGDIKLMFDNKNAAETVRAARIVKDMLRRGFALLVEIERDGEKVYVRAHDFDENACEYIIADFDPLGAIPPVPTVFTPTYAADIGEGQGEQSSSQEEGSTDTPAATPEPKGRRGRRRLPAAGTKAVAVARSAGG